MDALSISTKTSSKLQKLNDLVIEKDGEDRLKNICKYILQIIISGKTAIQIDSKDDENLTAISILLFEAAKAQATISQLRATLTECNVSNQASEMILALYDRHRDHFIQHIAMTGITMPQIVGVEWRLDYVVRSKLGGRENYPLFLISLKIKDRGLIRYIDFTATHEELQDLIGKIRDGVKQVDRVLNSKDLK